MLIDEYLPVVIISIVGIFFPIVTLLIGKLFRSTPHRKSKIKYETYECGEITIGTTRIPFTINYYLYALIFVIFDVETVFLFPWAVSIKSIISPLIGFLEMMFFIGILIIGLVYAWKEGALEWIMQI
ncbi:MAG: NADH-quinone oxidoreductase subunit A [Candidatus Altiarchaeales archaeon]|nr:MAG: NADH-quinone oxidoreductase subunit A [Candidatus Altiarchaeales archaeon]